MFPDAPDLALDIKDTIEERAVLCVTGRGAADAARAALAPLARRIEMDLPHGVTATGFAHALYQALHLDAAHGPAPADRAATNRRIDAHLARGGNHRTLVVPEAETLRRVVLQDLVLRWKRTPGPCPVILTGSRRLRDALAAAALDTLVYIWHELDGP